MKRENNEKIEKMKNENSRIQLELDKAKKEIKEINLEKAKIEDEKNNFNNEFSLLKNNVSIYLSIVYNILVHKDIVLNINIII